MVMTLVSYEATLLNRLYSCVSWYYMGVTPFYFLCSLWLTSEHTILQLPKCTSSDQMFGLHQPQLGKNLSHLRNPSSGIQPLLVPWERSSPLCSGSSVWMLTLCNQTVIHLTNVFYSIFVLSILRLRLATICPALWRQRMSAYGRTCCLTLAILATSHGTMPASSRKRATAAGTGAWPHVTKPTSTTLIPESLLLIQHFATTKACIYFL